MRKLPLKGLVALTTGLILAFGGVLGLPGTASADDGLGIKVKVESKTGTGSSTTPAPSNRTVVEADVKLDAGLNSTTNVKVDAGVNAGSGANNSTTAGADVRLDTSVTAGNLLDCNCDDDDDSTPTTIDIAWRYSRWHARWHSWRHAWWYSRWRHARRRCRLQRAADSALGERWYWRRRGLDCRFLDAAPGWRRSGPSRPDTRECPADSRSARGPRTRRGHSGSPAGPSKRR